MAETGRFAGSGSTSFASSGWSLVPSCIDASPSGPDTRTMVALAEADHRIRTPKSKTSRLSRILPVNLDTPKGEQGRSPGVDFGMSRECKTKIHDLVRRS